MNPPGGTQRAGLYLTNFALGGVQRVNLTVAEGLLANGWQVDLYVVDARGPLAGQVPSGVSVFNLGGSGAIKAFGRLLQTLRQRKPSVLMSSQPHLNTLAVLARLLGGYRGRLVLSEHVSPVQHAQGSAIRKDRLNPLMARLFYRFADAVVCVSAQVAEELRQMGAVRSDQVRVIHNPIVTSSLLKQAEEAVALPWQERPGMRLVLGAGRLTRQKDFATLVSAFAAVHSQEPGTRLLIIGEGEDKPALQAQIDALGLASVAHLGGFVANPYAYMRAADLFVMPSRWEGFGNVLVEALACGTPVCGTDCPHGPAEILAGGKFGRLSPVGDAPALAEAILASLAQPLPAEACRERARDFSLERIIPLYINALEGH